MKATEGAERIAANVPRCFSLSLSKLDDIENENMERFGWMSGRKGDTLGLEEGDKEKQQQNSQRGHRSLKQICKKGNEGGWMDGWTREG